MNDACLAILNQIYSMTECGKYVIIDQDDLCEWVQSGDNALSESPLSAARQAMQTLQKEGYLDVKYAYGESLCVAPLKKWEQPSPTPAPLPAPVPLNHTKIFLFALGGSFLGSLLAGLLVALVC
jgi:hypothetical protein